ncbi:MAG: STAS domain-containing protein [Planctomycetaceae bacterium]|jgi:anti-sigma B factor antagonist|nr:STAS domain-containing protein [Planctomycetaceae bacterium]
MSLSEFQPAFVSIESHGDTIVARFTRSQLSEEDNIEQMAHELVTLIDHYQCQRLAISMDIVEFITSAALGKLIMIHRKLHRRDGRLVVCDIKGSVAEVMKTSRLNEYFTIAADTPGALGLLAAL